MLTIYLTGPQIAVVILQSLLVLINVGGNFLVCYIILKNQDMRTPVNFLLVNLAVADMVVAIFLTPQLLSFHVSFTHPDGLIGTVLCKLLTTANFTYVGAGASVFTLICISVERYFNVLYPHGAKGRLTKRKLKVLVPCSWIFGVSLKVPAFLSYVYVKEVGGCVYLLTEEWMGKLLSMSWFIFLGFLPVVVMTALYSRVVYALWFKRSDNAGNNSQQGVMRVRKRVTLMVFIVSIIFGVCWGTNTVGYLMVDFFPRTPSIQ